MRDITIYLSLYSPVKVLEIGLDHNADLEFATPFATAGPSSSMALRSHRGAVPAVRA